MWDYPRIKTPPNQDTMRGPSYIILSEVHNKKQVNHSIKDKTAEVILSPAHPY